MLLKVLNHLSFIIINSGHLNEKFNFDIYSTFMVFKLPLHKKKNRNALVTFNRLTFVAA